MSAATPTKPVPPSQPTPAEIQDTILEGAKAAESAISKLPRIAKLNAMIQMVQGGKSVATALRDSGILGPTTSNQYDPSNPDEELAVEELFYKRCASKSKIIISDEAYALLSPDQRIQHHSNADLSAHELFKLVDWLYFIKALPLSGIAIALRVDPKIVARIKAELSNEFAKTIRLQSAEGYIADLMRTKDLLRADLMLRREKLGAAHPQQIALTRLLWELENNFIDRLQEIGIIDKNLGKLDVHEEWHVNIGPAGQPVNTKLKEISTSLDESDQVIDVETEKIFAVPQESPTEEANASANANSAATLGAAALADPKLRATIQVGQTE